jgi:hypothetical protein
MNAWLNGSLFLYCFSFYNTQCFATKHITSNLLIGTWFRINNLIIKHICNFFWQKYNHFSQWIFKVQTLRGTCILIDIFFNYDFDTKFHSKSMGMTKYGICYHFNNSYFKKINILNQNIIMNYYVIKINTYFQSLTL